MNEKMLIPVSILVAGLLVGTGIYFATSKKPAPAPVAKVENKSTKQSPKKVDPATEHIVGNANAEVFIIEYSDLECPFCKRYNNTASEKLVKKYAEDGKVAFVFRNMPLSSIHPSSFSEAVATECAAKAGGNDKFFEYKKAVFSETKSDGKFPTERLPQIAAQIGLDKTAFETCLKDEAITEKVKSSFEEAISAGVRGTPTVFIQLKDGQVFPIPADFKTIDDSLSAYLKKLN